LKLGYSHPDQLLENLTNTQLLEWRAFDELEPIGEYRQDYMMAQLTAMVFNIAQSVYGDKKAVKKVRRAEDFIPWLKVAPANDEAKEVSRGLSEPEDIRALFLTLKEQQDRKAQQREI